MIEAAGQTCSQCGWIFDCESLMNNMCKNCKSPILVESVAHLEKFEESAIKKFIAFYSKTLKGDSRDRNALIAIGVCYLKLGLFNLCDKFLWTLIDSHPDHPSGYYYRALSVFKGKRPRTASLPVVREAEKFLITATELDLENGRYDATLAVIKHDYYVLNGMRVPSPDPDALIDSAVEKHIDLLEIVQVLGLLHIPDGPMFAKLVS